MTLDEARRKIGTENWDAFNHWMRGQTIGTYLDGTTNIYECDVEAFLELLRSGYDRQQDPIAWD